MHYLHISEYLDWEEADILESLKIQDEKDFEISIPKATKLHFSSNEDIAIEYLDAAFVGQQLSNLATDFEYEQVGPEKHENISFFIKNVDVAKLAEVLCNISVAYGGDGDPLTFNEEVNEFIDQVESNHISPACPYFIEIYNEYNPSDFK